MIEQMAIGCILGDSYITKSGCLQIEHSIKQKEYVQWKFQFFQKENLTGKEPTMRSRLDKRTGKIYQSLVFYTKAKFKHLRVRFYPNGRKILPKEIDSMLVSNLALAVWFMDDGGKGANTPKGQIISVAGFDQNDQKRLQSCLSLNYKIEVTLHKNGQFYIPVKSVNLFHFIVTPLIIPSMRYKLSITP